MYTLPLGSLWSAACLKIDGSKNTCQKWLLSSISISDHYHTGVVGYYTASLEAHKLCKTSGLCAWAAQVTALRLNLVSRPAYQCNLWTLWVIIWVSQTLYHHAGEIGEITIPWLLAIYPLWSLAFIHFYFYRQLLVLSSYMFATYCGENMNLYTVDFMGMYYAPRTLSLVKYSNRGLCEYVIDLLYYFDCRSSIRSCGHCEPNNESLPGEIGRLMCMRTLLQYKVRGGWGSLFHVFTLSSVQTCRYFHH